MNNSLEQENNFLKQSIKVYMEGCEERQQKIDKAVTRIKTIINIIKEQPTDNIHTDMYIIGALNSLLYILEEVK